MLNFFFAGLESNTWSAFIINYSHQTVTLVTAAVLTAVFDILQTVFMLQCSYMVDYLIVLLEPLSQNDKMESAEEILKKFLKLM